MERKPLKRFGAMVVTGAIALLLIGCKGSAGPNGVNGTNGINGTNGTNGTSGTNGTNGIPGTTVAPLNASQLSTTAWSALSLKGAVKSVDMSAGTPKVTFTVTDQNGNGIAGLGGPGPDGMTKHLAFTIAKLIPANAASGAPSRWVNYEFVVPANGSTPASLTGFPDPETTGTLVDNLDGSYTYTYRIDITQAATIAAGVTLGNGQTLADLDDLSYQPTMVYRVAILAGGAPGGTAVANPANIFYDFLPSAPGTPVTAATDTRTIVDVTACNGCHTKLTLHAGYFPPAVDTRACVLCHTDQMKFGAGESRVAGSTVLTPAGTYGSTLKLDNTAVTLFPNFIHKIHMGDQLSMTGYSVFGTPINSTQFPQDVRNCVLCHSNAAASTLPGTGAVAPVTADGGNWMTAPSRMACGSCHDTTTFVNVANGPAATHAAGAYNDDSECATCHTATALPISHAPIYPYNTPNNPFSATAKTTATIASNPDATKLLNAHTLAWNILSVTVDAQFHPEMTFQVLQDGSPIALNGQPAANSTSTLIIPNYINGPTIAFRGGVPQDGILPADINFRVSASLQNIWAQVQSVTVAGSATKIVAGTLSGPATVGANTNVYTIVYTSATLPANTTMLEGMMYGFSTETDLPTRAGDATLAAGDINGFTNVSGDGVTTTGGVVIPTRAVIKAATPFATTAATTNGMSLTRRAILKQDACLSCHGNLGFFTGSNFHGGNRNDGNSCILCHNTTQSDSTGYSINAKNWIHGIHSGAFRTYAFTAAIPAGTGDWQVGYPGLLNNCEACHVPGSYAYANADQQAQLPNLLWNTMTQAYSATKTSPLAGNTAAGSFQAPGLKPVNVGGAAIATNFTTGATTYGVTAPSVNSAVTSPMTATCTGCHDSAPAVAHMVNNGGVFYSLRSAAVTPAGSTNLVSNEQCMICHGAGTVMDIQAVHAF